MFAFRKFRRALFSCNTRFEIRPFALLLTNWTSYIHYTSKVPANRLRKNNWFSKIGFKNRFYCFHACSPYLRKQ